MDCKEMERLAMIKHLSGGDRKLRKDEGNK